MEPRSRRRQQPFCGSRRAAAAFEPARLRCDRTVGSFVSSGGVCEVTTVRSVLFMSVLCLAFGSVAGAADRGSFAAAVVDPLGAPIAGASVALVRDGEHLASGTTDERGRVEFHDLAPGRYQLTVAATSFGTQTTDQRF